MAVSGCGDRQSKTAVDSGMKSMREIGCLDAYRFWFSGGSNHSEWQESVLPIAELLPDGSVKAHGIPPRSKGSDVICESHFDPTSAGWLHYSIDISKGNLGTQPTVIRASREPLTIGSVVARIDCEWVIDACYVRGVGLYAIVILKSIDDSRPRALTLNRVRDPDCTVIRRLNRDIGKLSIDQSGSVLCLSPPGDDADCIMGSVDGDRFLELFKCPASIACISADGNTQAVVVDGVVTVSRLCSGKWAVAMRKEVGSVDDLSLDGSGHLLAVGKGGSYGVLTRQYLVIEVESGEVVLQSKGVLFGLKFQIESVVR